MKLNNQSRRKFEELLVTKAFKDSSFKTALIENPKIAISQYFGTQLPTEIEIRVLQETDKVLYVVLPHT
ncbi:MAG: NHLP leader peptide family RiPP precursor [Cyanobacteria bacterium J06628_3]